jgi:hypothetical protein
VDSDKEFVTLPAGLTTVEITSDAVFAYENVTAEVAVIVYVPLNVESTLDTVTDSPTEKRCGAEVVKVATFDVNDLLEISIVLSGTTYVNEVEPTVSIM